MMVLRIGENEANDCNKELVVLLLYELQTHNIGIILEFTIGVNPGILNLYKSSIRM